MFEWKQEYTVGISQIDAQHQALFRMAADLYAAMSAGQGAKAVSRTLDRLVQYTEHHFATEERLMRQYQFAELEEHKRMHAVLAKKVVEFQEEFHAGRTLMTVEIFRFLRDWLEVHILKSDMKYADFIRARAA